MMVQASKCTHEAVRRGVAIGLSSEGITSEVIRSMRPFGSQGGAPCFFITRGFVLQGRFVESSHPTLRILANKGSLNGCTRDTQVSIKYYSRTITDGLRNTPPA